MNRRQRPDFFLIVLRGDQGGGVRLVQIAAQLGKHLVEAYAHGNGDAQLLAGAAAQLGCNLHARARMIAYIQPAFIQAEGFYLAGILGVHGAHAARIVYVFFAVRRQQNQAGALFKRAADGFARAHAALLGRVALGQDGAVALLGIAAYRYGLVAQAGIAGALHRGIKAVAVAVQDRSHNFLTLRTFVRIHYNRT